LLDRVVRDFREITAELVAALETLDLPSRVAAQNEVKEQLHLSGPFRDEPVDCVLWVEQSVVHANDYNPNAVAPPEMELLRLSILHDGYTQPVVGDLDDEAGRVVVVDGFHRNRVARECPEVSERVKGYLPVVFIRESQRGRPDRIASTIRHNRARGKHQVEQMSNIVVELKKRNWSDLRIGKELGMDPDEVLRLTQISGLADVFKDQEFSEAWEAAEGKIETALDEDGEEVSLEWVNSPIPDDLPPGWCDRTEQSSILYGTRPRVIGLVQKSHVLEKWHWYCYSIPMQSGESPTRDEAKVGVEKAQREGKW
jgi:ParB-like chromosome segregation protein Spo0J